MSTKWVSTWEDSINQVLKVQCRVQIQPCLWCSLWKPCPPSCRMSANQINYCHILLGSSANKQCLFLYQERYENQHHESWPNTYICFIRVCVHHCDQEGSHMSHLIPQTRPGLFPPLDFKKFFNCKWHPFVLVGSATRGRHDDIYKASVYTSKYRQCNFTMLY